MNIANTDEELRHELLARDMFLSDLATDLDAAEKKGMEKGIARGIEQGIEQGRIDIAIRMIADGLPHAQIQKYSGLTIEQIEELSRKNSNEVCESPASYKSPRKKRKK